MPLCVLANSRRLKGLNFLTQISAVTWAEVYPGLHFSARASFRDRQSVTNGLVQHDKPLLLHETKRRLALASTANLIFCEALQKETIFCGNGSYYGISSQIHRIGSKQNTYKLHYSRYISLLLLNIVNL